METESPRGEITAAGRRHGDGRRGCGNGVARYESPRTLSRVNIVYRVAKFGMNYANVIILKNSRNIKPRERQPNQPLVNHTYTPPSAVGPSAIPPPPRHSAQQGRAVSRVECRTGPRWPWQRVPLPLAQWQSGCANARAPARLQARCGSGIASLFGLAALLDKMKI